MMIHIRHGKGAKDRYVPLPQRTLQLLRDYCRTHRHPALLFPAEGRAHLELAKATKPISKSSVQDAFRLPEESGNYNPLISQFWRSVRQKEKKGEFYENAEKWLSLYAAMA